MKRKQAIALSATAALAMAAVVIGVKLATPVELLSLEAVASTPAERRRAQETSEAQRPQAAELALVLKPAPRAEFTWQSDGWYRVHGALITGREAQLLYREAPGSFIQVRGDLNLHYVRNTTGRHVLHAIKPIEPPSWRNATIAMDAIGVAFPFFDRNDQVEAMPFGEHPFGPWRTGGSSVQTSGK